MKRKLVKQGQGALSVTLPIKWVRQKQLKAGDEIDITPVEGTLVIGTQYKETGIHTASLGSFNQSHLRTLLASHYRLGTKKLILQYKTAVAANIIESVVGTVPGCELVQAEGKQFQFSFYHNEYNAEQEINRMFQLIVPFFELVNNKVEISEIQRKTIMKQRDKTLTALAQIGSTVSYEQYTLVVFMEKVAGTLYYLSKDKRASRKNIEEYGKLFSIAKDCYAKRIPQTCASLYASVRSLPESEGKDRLLKEYLLGIASRLQAIIPVSAY